MKKLLNTLYVLTPDSYLYVRNGSVAIRVGTEEKYSIPAHNLDAIVCFGQNTVSTPLIGLCAENGITLAFISGTGKFIGRFCGPVSGNVLLLLVAPRVGAGIEIAYRLPITMPRIMLPPAWGRELKYVAYARYALWPYRRPPRGGRELKSELGTGHGARAGRPPRGGGN